MSVQYKISKRVQRDIFGMTDSAILSAVKFWQSEMPLPESAYYDALLAEYKRRKLGDSTDASSYSPK